MSPTDAPNWSQAVEEADWIGERLTDDNFVVTCNGARTGSRPTPGCSILLKFHTGPRTPGAVARSPTGVGCP